MYLWKIDDGPVGQRRAETVQIAANHTSAITVLRSFDDGKKFMSGGNDRRVRIIHFSEYLRMTD